MQSGAQGIQGRFVHSLAKDASAGQVADTALVIWRDIDAALSPIIGGQGVAALLRRSQYLVRDVHPWLASLQHDVPAARAFDALHAALAAQAAPDSMQGNVALMQVFEDLLASLIGASLCERLLRSVLTPPSSGPAAQDAPQ